MVMKTAVWDSEVLLLNLSLKVPQGHPGENEFKKVDQEGLCFRINPLSYLIADGGRLVLSFSNPSD